MNEPTYIPEIGKDGTLTLNLNNAEIAWEFIDQVIERELAAASCWGTNIEIYSRDTGAVYKEVSLFELIKAELDPEGAENTRELREEIIRNLNDLIEKITALDI